MPTSTTLEPMLTVDGSGPAIRFYESAFGAVCIYIVGDPEGDAVARLQIGDARFWLHGGSAEHGNPTPRDLKGTPCRLVLIVEDPDATHAQAIAAGAVALGPIIDEHGWRTGRLVDPYGHHWEIAKELT